VVATQPDEPPKDPVITPLVEGFGSLNNVLLSNRIIFVDKFISDVQAQRICGSLMALELADPDEEIRLYINCPGGSYYSIIAIMDMMNTIKPDVSTTVFGSSFTQATILLAAGAKGKRFAMPNARIMLAQPWGGAQGNYYSVGPTILEQNRNFRIYSELYAKYTGQEPDFMIKEMDRDTFLTPPQALEMGLIDAVLEPQP